MDHGHAEQDTSLPTVVESKVNPPSDTVYMLYEYIYLFYYNIIP